MIPTPEDNTKVLTDLMDHWSAIQREATEPIPKPLGPLFHNPLPKEVRKLYPVYDPHSLVIMAWSARVSQENDEANSAPQVYWFNSSFRHFVKNQFDTAGLSESEIELLSRAVKSHDNDSIELPTLFELLTRKTQNKEATKFTTDLLNLRRALIRNFDDIKTRLPNETIWFDNDGNISHEASKTGVVGFAQFIGDSCDRRMIGRCNRAVE